MGFRVFNTSRRWFSCRIPFYKALRILCIAGAGLVLAGSVAQGRTPVLEALYSFERPDLYSSGELVLGSDGSFYGTTPDGGANGLGTVFRVTPEGKLTTLASFNGSLGSHPYGGLVKAGDGNFYGTTSNGGEYRLGTVFRVTPGGALTTLASFNPGSGRHPYAALVEGENGRFYGTTAQGGVEDYGTVFMVTAGGRLETVASFTRHHGRNPESRLIRMGDGRLYGTTPSGGANRVGTVFTVSPNGKLRTLVSFNVVNGQVPRGGVVQGSDGNLYGTTSFGGVANRGTVFRVTPGGMLTTVAAFDEATGRQSLGRLVQGAGGIFYGTTREDGIGNRGTIFSVGENGSLTTLVSFDGQNGAPSSGLVRGDDGDFYGMTSFKGGAVFRMTPGGALTTLVSLHPDGMNDRSPQVTLVQGSDGDFYGTALQGGAHGFGAVFKISVLGKRTILGSFNSTDGRSPGSGLVEGIDGAFYGVTQYGGAADYGTVFKVTGEGIESLASFSGDTGRHPQALVQGNDGNFYGTTGQGGEHKAGTIFRMTPEGELTTLAAFNRNTTGSSPTGRLEQGRDGNFYGTTPTGGAESFGIRLIPGEGTVFKVTPTGELTPLIAFINTKGAAPYAGVVEGRDGNFYGTTSGGAGTVFRVTPAGELTTLVSFNFDNGFVPGGGLIEGSDGNFYGTMSRGGATGDGLAFRITPDGVLSILASFGSGQGRYPGTGLVQGRDGNFYGTTSAGGAFGGGTLFRLQYGPTAVTRDAVNVLDGSAVIEGSVNANGAVTDVVFEWGTAADLLDRTAPVGGIGSGRSAVPVSLVLNGLSPNTTYWFRVRGDNLNQFQPQRGEILSFTTGDGITVPPSILDGPGGGDYPFGQSVELSVIATGGTPLGYQWKRDGEAIDGATESVCRFAMTDETWGRYTVVVSNAGGSVESEAAVVSVRESFVPVNAFYGGMIDAGPGGLGQVTLKTARGEKGGGVFTGSLILGGEAYRFKGSANANGAILFSAREGRVRTLRIGRKGLPPLWISIDWGIVNAKSRIVLTVTDGTDTWILTANQAEWGARNRPPQFGLHTLLLGRDGIAPKNAGDKRPVPAGIGWGRVRVTRDGMVKLGGRLPDGQAFTSAGLLDAGGRFRLYAGNRAKAARGAAFGELAWTQDAEGEWQLDGELTWRKPGHRSGNIYRDGFELALSVHGEEYAPPDSENRDARSLAGVNWPVFDFTGGNLGRGFRVVPSWSRSNRFTPVLPLLELASSGNRGTFTGAFWHPVTGSTCRFSGAFLQKSRIGGGMFFGEIGSGAVRMQAD